MHSKQARALQTAKQHQKTKDLSGEVQRAVAADLYFAGGEERRRRQSKARAWT